MTYSSIDNKWNQYISKGDRIQFSLQGQTYQGIVDLANSNGVQVTLITTKKQVELAHNSYSIVERRLNLHSAISIEPGDLIYFMNDGTGYTGIVSSFDAAKSVVVVDLGPMCNNSRHQVAPNKLSFLAKGWTWNMFFQNSVQQGSVSVTQISQAKTNQQGVAAPINTVQNASSVALLYPAPCVVMAVPYNTNPDSFPEAMFVQMPDRPPNQPTLLPVVRMGCDTALVVIPPSKNRAGGTVNVTTVKTSPAPNRGNSVGV